LFFVVVFGALELLKILYRTLFLVRVFLHPTLPHSFAPRRRPTTLSTKKSSLF